MKAKWNFTWRVSDSEELVGGLLTGDDVAYGGYFTLNFPFSPFPKMFPTISYVVPFKKFPII